VSQTHTPAQTSNATFLLEQLAQADELQFSHGHNIGASHA
jgi:hypothetical protein